MSRLVCDLEPVLTGLVEEHRKLLALAEQHEQALRKLDLKAIEQFATEQEGIRLRIAMWENRRRAIVQQITRTLRLDPNTTLPKLAALHPPKRDVLLKLRDELKRLAAAVSARVQVAGRVAGAVLGHLNTAVRLLAGAVERAGVYTKQGTPHLSRRIGSIEAVG